MKKKKQLSPKQTTEIIQIIQMGEACFPVLKGTGSWRLWADPGDRADILATPFIGRNGDRGRRGRGRVANNAHLQRSSGGKSIQISYFSKSKDTLIENDSSKSESPSKIPLE
jgi:hypothetical protein